MKKLYSAILLISFIFNISNICSSAIDKKNSLNYIALGDSIALGFQPNNAKLKDGSYSTLLKRYLENTHEQVTLKNYAISGQTTEDMVKQLNDLDITAADIITISIGSNDLLKPFTKIIYDSLECSNENDFNTSLRNLIESAKNYNVLSLIKIYSIINSIIKNDETFNKSIANIEKNFIKISKIIKEKNPNTKIIVTNFYNPYAFIESFGFKSFGEFTNNILKKANSKLDKIAAENNFEVVDISFMGNNKDYLNIVLNGSDIMVDPHPNQLGHNKIYENIIKVIK